MPTEGGTPSSGAPSRRGEASDATRWADVERFEFALRGLTDEDQVAAAVLSHLVDLPGVSGVGLALAEGAGRRLRFIASGRQGDTDAWCHIDAYDDVPLTTVLRTGEPVWGNLDDLEDRYAGIVAKQRQAGTCAMAALPLRGGGSVLGGLLFYFATPQPFDAGQAQLLETCARRTTEALRSVHDARVAAAHRDPAATDREASQAASVELDADPTAASVARRFVRRSLDEWGVDEETSDNAQLCVSELVTNAVMHARASSELSVLLEGEVLEVVLRDHGGSTPQSPPEPLHDEDDDLMAVFGRGLSVVDAVADRWGTERDDHGTVAWFVLELAGDSSRAG